METSNLLKKIENNNIKNKPIFFFYNSKPKNIISGTV